MIVKVCQVSVAFGADIFAQLVFFATQASSANIAILGNNTHASEHIGHGIDVCVLVLLSRAHRHCILVLFQLAFDKFRVIASLSKSQQQSQGIGVVDFALHHLILKTSVRSSCQSIVELALCRR